MVLRLDSSQCIVDLHGLVYGVWLWNLCHMSMLHCQGHCSNGDVHHNLMWQSYFMMLHITQKCHLSMFCCQGHLCHSDISKLTQMCHHHPSHQVSCWRTLSTQYHHGQYFAQSTKSWIYVTCGCHVGIENYYGRSQ